MTLETVRRTIEKHRLLSANQKVTVAVSGGADSVALLHIFLRLASHFGVQLHVASLHHGIRPQAQDDLDFVQRLAETRGLPCTLGKVDVPQLAREQGMGIEEAARQARYDFLAQAAVQAGSSCVAVAHHAKDQAETVLMHIIRGSGLRGLRGMRFAAPMPGHPDITLVRPLLAMTRQDLENYCQAHGLDFRHDDSNDDLRFRRNFVRHEILPRLQQLNPNVEHALARLADSSSVDEDYLSSQFESTVMPQVHIGEYGWSLPRAVYASLHPAMRRRWFREACRRLGGESLAHHNTRGLVRWAGRAAVGTERDLGGSLRLRVAYEHLRIEHQSAPMDEGGYRLIDAETNMALTPAVGICPGRLNIRVLSSGESDADGICLRLPADVKLCLRTRRPGEGFKPRGMGGKSRKIKDWMIDRKIPRKIRSKIPLISADGEVIAVCVGDIWHLADLSRFQTGADSAICLILD